MTTLTRMSGGCGMTLSYRRRHTMDSLSLSLKMLDKARKRRKREFSQLFLIRDSVHWEAAAAVAAAVAARAAIPQCQAYHYHGTLQCPQHREQRGRERADRQLVSRRELEIYGHLTGGRPDLALFTVKMVESAILLRSISTLLFGMLIVGKRSFRWFPPTAKAQSLSLFFLSTQRCCHVNRKKIPKRNVSKTELSIKIRPLIALPMARRKKGNQQKRGPFSVEFFSIFPSYSFRSFLFLTMKG